MTIETILTYALRLWLAGALHTGVVLAQIGPFALAGLGFAGWQWAQRGPGVQRQRIARDEDAEAPPKFVLR